MDERLTVLSQAPIPDDGRADCLLVRTIGLGSSLAFLSGRLGSRAISNGCTSLREGCNAGREGAREGGTVVIPHPPGGDSAAETIERGLKNLVLYVGPNVRELCRYTKPGFRALMEAASVPDDWADDAKASALLMIIQELVEAIHNPRWHAAAMAAFRLPASEYVGDEYDSRNARWKALAERQGYEEAEIKQEVLRYRDHWRGAVTQLAADLSDRLSELNRSPASWYRFQAESAPQPPLPLAAPISFDRIEVLYELQGNRCIKCTSWRWVTAHEPVTCYEAVGWYYSEPSAPVEIVPIAHCTLDGPLHELPMGGVLGRLRFSHTLEPGEHYFFAYETRFNSQRPCRPAILYDIRSRELRELTVRVLFDSQALPRKIWYLNVGTQTDGWQVPEDGAPEILQVAPDGYVEHRFEVCRHGRMYGLRWEWQEKT
jgi:hypothetical protein